MSPLVPITTLLSRRQRDGDTVAFSISDDWGQGRTTFGGLVGALAVAAMRDVTGSNWPLRALQASFIGPVSNELLVSVHLLRQGRHVRQVQATLSTHGETAAVLLGVFVRRAPRVCRCCGPSARLSIGRLKRRASCHSSKASHRTSSLTSTRAGLKAICRTRTATRGTPAFMCGCAMRRRTPS